MLLQVEIPTEPLIAETTREGLDVAVRVHVEGKVVNLVEGLLADGALELLGNGVGQSVVLVVDLLVEPLAAEVTAEGFEALVDAEVRVEGGRAVECLATSAALVRLVRGVDDLVAAERARLTEPLPANLAHERARSCNTPA